MSVTAAGFFRQIADQLQEAEDRPYGPEHTPEERSVAADACVRLCAGDQDKARSLWKLVAQDCNGYLPHAAACALIRAAGAEYLVGDIEAPAVS